MRHWDGRSTTAAVAGLVAVACGGGPDGATDGARAEVLVSAAASLTDAFGDLEAAFERTHPDVDVKLNLAGSSTLRIQILEGAPVDVYAPANEAHMDRVVEADLVEGEPRVFALNRLRVAVPRGNPAGVDELADFADEELLIGLCAPEVPCGGFAREALRRAGVDPAVDTNEPDVRALLTKIAAGELDAGITYATDVTSAGGVVEGIELPEGVDVVARYPVAVLRDAPHPEDARAFVAFLLSEDGRSILRDHGFLLP